MALLRMTGKGYVRCLYSQHHSGLREEDHTMFWINVSGVSRHVICVIRIEIRSESREVLSHSWTLRYFVQECTV